MSEQEGKDKPTNELIAETVVNVCDLIDRFTAWLDSKEDE